MGVSRVAHSSLSSFSPANPALSSVFRYRLTTSGRAGTTLVLDGRELASTMSESWRRPSARG